MSEQQQRRFVFGVCHTKGKHCARQWAKLAEEKSNHLNPSDIQNFEKSEAAREAIKDHRRVVCSE